MKPILLVFLGGGLGSALRFLISKMYNAYFPHFFLGTFLVNTIGCLLIGFFLSLSMRGQYLTTHHVLFLVTGFCGGFTTFSAFAMEKYDLLSGGHFLQFALYLFSSLFSGILAVALGLWLGKLL